ncbi:MAG: hypothetical protein K6F49_10880 [Saccharofermentans sp.]|nr:hypothetical protein [Saccharofermentans sp.]
MGSGLVQTPLSRIDRIQAQPFNLKPGGGYVYEYNRDTGVAIIYNPWFDNVGEYVDPDMIVEGLDEIHNC